MVNNKDIKVTVSEQNEIKKGSPATLPLNASNQGFSAQEIRRRLSKSIVGEKGSVLSLIKSKSDLIYEKFEEVDDKKLSRSGGTMTGDVHFSNKTIHDLKELNVETISSKEDNEPLLIKAKSNKGLKIIDENGEIIASYSNENNVWDFKKAVRFSAPLQTSETGQEFEFYGNVYFNNSQISGLFNVDTNHIHVKDIYVERDIIFSNGDMYGLRDLSVKNINVQTIPGFSTDGHKIKDVSDPTHHLDASNKRYVDDKTQEEFDKIFDQLNYTEGMM